MSREGDARKLEKYMVKMRRSRKEEHTRSGKNWQPAREGTSLQRNRQEGVKTENSRRPGVREGLKYSLFQPIVKVWGGRVKFY